MSNVYKEAGPTPNYYRYSWKGLKIDPYRVLLIYKITHPAHQHAIKKLLRAGGSVKELRQDIREVIDSLTRWVEMIDEDAPDAVVENPPM